MRRKHYLLIIAVLVITNIVTFTVFLIKPQPGEETVATVGKNPITRQEWLEEMEERYGESVLKDLIDQKLIGQMAEKYNITVSEKDIDRELILLKTSSYGQEKNQSEEKMRKQIKYSLLLEEILTKDVNISDNEMKNYYGDNKELFIFPATFQLSQIMTNTKKQAEQTIKELKSGSNFSVLAMERSIDDFSANQGGNIGYVSEGDNKISEATLKKLKKLKPGNWTQPIKKDDGYVIYLLHEKIPEKKYTYKEVKSQIRRQLALEQMERPVSADLFWDEAKIEWFYGEKSN